MAELNSVQLSDFVKNADIIFLKAQGEAPAIFRTSGLCKVVPIAANSGNTREFSETDGNEYLSYKGEGDAAVHGTVQQGYSNTMTAVRQANNLAITWEMRNFNKYPEVVSRLTGAGRQGVNSIELDLTHRFTFGTVTTYTDRDGRTVAIDCGDDLQLFYTAHLLKGAIGVTTYRNRLANNPRVSKGAIEGMERLIVEETYNQLGELKPNMPFDIIWTGPDPNTVNTVREYLRSTASPDAAHAGVVNVYQGKYRPVVLPLLATTAAGAPDTTKRYYWGIASSSYSSMYLGVWEEPHLIAPSSNSNSEDIQTDDWEFRQRACYGITTVGAPWVKASTGDGTS